MSEIHYQAAIATVHIAGEEEDGLGQGRGKGEGGGRG